MAEEATLTPAQPAPAPVPSLSAVDVTTPVQAVPVAPPPPPPKPKLEIRPGKVETLKAWLIDTVPFPPLMLLPEHLPYLSVGNTSYTKDEKTAAVSELVEAGIIGNIDGWLYQKRRRRA